MPSIQNVLLWVGSSFIYLCSVYQVFFICIIMVYFQSNKEQAEYLVVSLQAPRQEKLHDQQRSMHSK